MACRLESAPATQPELHVPSAHSILFFGDILPGHDVITCRKQLQALLKCPAETMDSVFSGKRICLRNDLAADAARRYQQRLEGFGLRIVIDPPLPSAQSPDDPTPAVAVAVAVAAPPAEGMTCPACGERQPRRTLCRACSIDMPSYIAAQTRRRTAEPGQAVSTRPHGAADTAPAMAGSGILGLGFRGRFGRRNFLLTGLLTLGGSFALAVVALNLGTPGMLIGGLGMLALVIYGTRSAVCRLHDLGLSGWWALATWIPYVGVVAALLLLIVPGQKGGNAWGEPARPVPAPGLLGGMAVTGASVFFAIGIVGSPLPALQALPGLTGSNESGKAAFAERYDAGRDRIIMYSLSTCGFCAEKRRQFDSIGVRYTEYLIDEDASAEARLNDRLHRAGLGGGAIGTPIIEVNGTLLPNNPGFGEIGRHLSRATKG